MNQGPNALELYLSARKLPEVQAMDALQDANVISDNAVWAHDVADDVKAVEWLKKNFKANEHTKRRIHRVSKDGTPIAGVHHHGKN